MTACQLHAIISTYAERAPSTKTTLVVDSNRYRVTSSNLDGAELLLLERLNYQWVGLKLLSIDSFTLVVRAVGRDTSQSSIVVDTPRTELAGFIDSQRVHTTSSNGLDTTTVGTRPELLLLLLLLKPNKLASNIVILTRSESGGVSFRPGRLARDQTGPCRQYPIQTRTRLAGWVRGTR